MFELTDEIEDRLRDMLVDTGANDKEVAEELGIPYDELPEIMRSLGYLSCPECSRYVEMGEMVSNPEDESEQVCEACAIGQGW